MPTAASSSSPSCPTTVCCPVVVPAQLTATGVSGLRPLATSCSPTYCDVGGVDGEHERARACGERLVVGGVDVAQVGLGAHRTDRHAGVGRGADPERDARDDVERHDRLGDGERFLDRAVVGERVAGDQPDDGLRRRAPRRAAPWRSRPASDSAGRDLAGRQRGDRRRAPAASATTTSAPERIASAACVGQQAGVAGPGSHEGDPSDDLARAGHVVLPIIVSAPSASSSAASRRPTPSASVVGPVADSRTASLPSSAVTDPRRKTSRSRCRPPIALGDLGQRADRGRAAGLERGEQRPLGRDGGAGVGVVERGQQRRAPRRRRSGTRSPARPARARAAPGSGRGSRSPRRRGRAGAARRRRATTASSSPSATRARAGCRRCRAAARPRCPSPSARSCAARRGEPVPTREPGGSSPSVSPSRATSASRGSSRGGTAAMVMPVGRRGRQVLVGVDGDVDLVGEQRGAQRRHEHAGAAELVDRGGRPVALGDDRDDLDRHAERARRRRRSGSGRAR